jgi:hypothetical protein
MVRSSSSSSRLRAGRRLSGNVDPQAAARERHGAIRVAPGYRYRGQDPHPVDLAFIPGQPGWRKRKGIVSHCPSGNCYVTLIAGKTACDAFKIERRNWMRWAYRPPAGERLLLDGRTKRLKAEYLAEKTMGFIPTPEPKTSRSQPLRRLSSARCCRDTLDIKEVWQKTPGSRG